MLYWLSIWMVVLAVHVAGSNGSPCGKCYWLSIMVVPMTGIIGCPCGR